LERHGASRPVLNGERYAGERYTGGLAPCRFRKLRMHRPQDITTATKDAAIDELDDAVEKIAHCLGQLTSEQVWWRPSPSMNSIANLILHLCGNVRQWITAGVGGAKDVRNRPLEFSEQGPIETDELLRRLKVTVAEAKSAIANASTADLVDRRQIQGFEVTGIGAVIYSVAHFRGHVQEIVHLTRSQLGDAYRFDFVPKTPEQGAT
jgi:hypothetical protein